MRIEVSHTQPRVDEHMFIVGDRDRWSEPLSKLSFEDDIFFSHDAGLVLYSSATSFYADLSLEVYDSEPGPGVENDQIDARRETSARFDSGEITVRDLNGLEYDTLALPTEGRWNIRLIVRGRERAEERARDEYFFYGEEEWTIQLWPGE
ncbi:hypothetical protein [Saccharopolyspora shandongensis]|uniref:hypothetical protein n=1 Tax=Saccharopolyspora shandongensis TaxID=418495 RepID=UPI00115F96CC|nr:hypothetical protein [Saccharopolyspora shandongensis]